MKRRSEDLEENKKRKQSKLWDIIAHSGDSRISRGGWRNSYDGELFTEEEMEEFSDNVFLKLSHILEKKSVVALEIGCASGLTMYKLAPYCKRYIGTDIASYNISINKEYNKKRNINNIELVQCAADEIGVFSDEWITLVILNSVVQYFEGENYFIDVIKKAISIIAGEGVIFIGDVRDLQKKEQYEESVCSYKSKMGLPMPLERRELFLNRSFFESLVNRFPEHIKNIEISNKIGAIENELLKYRYDVIIYLK